MKRDFSDQTVVLWGLDETITNDALVEKVFSFLNDRHSLPTSTVNHGQPECRIFGYDRLSDGYLYFMTSKGKPAYGQMKENPQIVMTTMVQECFSVRVHGWVEEIGKGEIWDEFFGINPGTVKMYRNNPDIMALFRVYKGEGEIFHIHDADKVKRLRFGFGGVDPCPMTYYIDATQCLGCGACFDSCAEESIVINADGTYRIIDFACDGCGICYTKCPLAGKALINRIETEKGYYENT